MTSAQTSKSYTYDVYGEPTATGTLANEFLPSKRRAKTMPAGRTG